MIKDPALRLQDYLVFGEFGEVNPSVSDSSTFTFLSADTMAECFEGKAEGCFLYSRHLNPSNDYLARALALMENTEHAQVTGSGMAAIVCTVLQICNSGDEIISSHTIYGGTYAFFKNFLPRFSIHTHFVDTNNLEAVRNKITPKTKIIYCETISNPLLEVADIRALRALADQYGLLLVVDNTFSPMIIMPHEFGAHFVIHSLTKYINGASDCVAGAICAKKEFIDSLKDVNSGAAMLLGPVLDSYRSANILKNLRTLHVRLHQHSKNAMYIAYHLDKLGIKVYYPGLPTHPQHELIKTMLTPGYGYGGIIAFDAKDVDISNKLMIKMQEAQIGYFAVSLGFYKTLFSSPGSSTSSEIPKEEQIEMGITDGLVRMSVGLDNNIELSFEKIKNCLKEVGLI
jgi:methionine-gamma-lyase